MNLGRVSVIMPAYNVEQYLEDCMESILSQKTRYSYRIVLIDDGSTDESGNISKEYKLKYPQTIVVHKENGGLSDARNSGLDIMTGEYVACVDSDDFVHKDYIKILKVIIKH